MAEAPLFMTQRRAVIDAYKAANQPFSASTKPYKSTVSWLFNDTNVISAASVSWLVARAGQRLEWFGYKIADVVPGNQGVPSYRTATEADTNISKARTTNGAEDFIIEGISASHRSTRINYEGEGGTGDVPDIDDPDVLNAVSGLAPILDPGALYAPPQVQSPFNLEDALYRALAPHVAVEFEWDRNKVVKIGTLEQIPEGAANTYLRASGEPSTNDRYRIPEGYLWRREGQPDCEFIVRGTLTEAVCIPILNIALPVSGSSSTFVLGSVRLDSVVRLHGLSVKLPSRN